MDPSERLTQVIDYLISTRDVKNASDFAREIGKTRADISNIKNRKQGLTARFAKVVSTRFPIINNVWLEHGIGEMLVPQTGNTIYATSSGNSTANASINISNDSSLASRINELERQIEEMQERLAEARAQAEEYKHRAEEYWTLIKTLTTQS